MSGKFYWWVSSVNCYDNRGARVKASLSHMNQASWGSWGSGGGEPECGRPPGSPGQDEHAPPSKRRAGGPRGGGQESSMLHLGAFGRFLSQSISCEALKTS